MRMEGREMRRKVKRKRERRMEGREMRRKVKRKSEENGGKRNEEKSEEKDRGEWRENK